VVPDAIKTRRHPKEANVYGISWVIAQASAKRDFWSEHPLPYDLLDRKIQSLGVRLTAISDPVERLPFEAELETCYRRREQRSRSGA